jgi:hypothetical protein
MQHGRTIMAGCSGSLYMLDRDGGLDSRRSRPMQSSGTGVWASRLLTTWQRCESRGWLRALGLRS